jgi:adenylate cyclase
MAFAQRCPGGAEVEISMLFADVRGSTQLAERMSPTDFSRLMNHFYNAATDVLIETDAVIDKLVGDEVIGLYFPLFTGPDHAGPAVTAARRLLAVARNLATTDGTPLAIGVGVHTGNAFVGTVSGAGDAVSDITALGDNVNVAARLASMAGPGEAFISEDSCRAAGWQCHDAEVRRLQLKGRNESVSIRVMRADQTAYS